MHIHHAIIVLVCAAIVVQSAPKLIYVDPSGEESASADGTRERPFRAISHALKAAPYGLGKVQAADGFVLYLKPGAEYRERLAIDPETGGGPTVPITLTSDPSNPSIIIPPSSFGTAKSSAVQASGVSVSRSNVTVENQKIIGSGMDNNKDGGISAYAGSAQLSALTIRNCEVSGWGGEGITIGGNGGFKDVLVEGCKVHDNRRNGMSTWGPVAANYNYVVRNCEFYNNLGDPNESAIHTGSGIIMGGVTKGLIEYCTAYNNGERCKTSGGPVGIWTYDATDVTIQYCESYSNHAVNKDGGGFDLDGGAQGCIIQYCYSHDNDGAGYLLCQYGGARTFTNNTIRYCISQNDGRKRDAGGFFFYSSVGNNKIYGNTVYSAYRPAIKYSTSSPGNRIWNNIFYTQGQPIISSLPPTSSVLFQGNCYWTVGSTFSLSSFQSAGQENLNGNNVGMYADPQITGAGQAGIVGVSNLKNMAQYRLQTGSPCRNAGINIKSLFSVDPGARDFFGTTTPQGGSYDIGAHEAAGSTEPLTGAHLVPAHRSHKSAVIYSITGQRIKGGKKHGLGYIKTP